MTTGLLNLEKGISRPLTVELKKNRDLLWNRCRKVRTLRRNVRFRGFCRVSMLFYQRITIILLLLAEVAFLSGCVRRRLTIRTDPPGAVAYLDNAELGKTPISRNFDYYGKRELKLVKEGYEPHTEMIQLRAPWYEWPIVDFFSEVVIPGTITDERVFPVKLKPQRIVSPDDLIAEGERMKAIAHSNGTYRVSSGRARSTIPQDVAPAPPMEYHPTDTAGEVPLSQPYPTPTFTPPADPDAVPLTAPMPEYQPAPSPWEAAPEPR